MKKSKSYKFWDRVSGWSKAESAANSGLVKLLGSRFPVYIKPSDTVLDFGCGTGTITLRIGGHAKTVRGVDVSTGMLVRAQQNLSNNRIENVTFTKITELDGMFNNDYFEAITCFNVLQYIEDRKELLKRFYKLLNPGGTLMIAVPCFNSKKSPIVLLLGFMGFMRIMPKTYFLKVDEMEKEAVDAGFAIVESSGPSNSPEKFIVAKKAE